MKFLSVVHLVDTEGPLFEPLNITFKRINELFNLKIKPSKKNLQKIINKTIDLPLNKKDRIIFFNSFNENILSYNKNLGELNSQNKIIFSKKFRKKFKDSFNKDWLINWNCVDHINYVSNPQKRLIGTHKIYDYYNKLIKLNKSKDEIHFHFHPQSISNHANTTGNHYFSHSNNIYQILSKRIIDRNWFPSSYRAGFHIENPDSNWFLEQFIPFDYSNQSTNQKNLNYGRFENWQSSTQNWTPYHPAHDDYRVKGNCRRFIARCLNIGTRISTLNNKEVEKAFVSKKKGVKTILAFTNHDFRSMFKDFDDVYRMLNDASKKYDLKFKFCGAREAFNNEFGKSKKRLKFNIKLKNNTLYIKSNKKIFGPQPFLAIKDKNKKYFHENFFIEKPFYKWRYTFDRHSLEMKKVLCFAFAANDKNGFTTIVKIFFKNKKFKIENYNI